MPETKNLIEIKHISKKFGDLTVLKDISLKVKEKEVVVIIGPSGSGKSTLLRCINGLETPTSGAIFFDGLEVNGEKNINYVRTEVGMVFQRFNLFPHMTVLQNLMLAPMKVRKISSDEAKERGMLLLKKVGLADKADYKPAQLSGGQQQREEQCTEYGAFFHGNPLFLFCRRTMERGRKHVIRRRWTALKKGVPRPSSPP